MTDYQKYQLQWMIDHDHPIDELIAELTGYQFDSPQYVDDTSEPISEIYREWELDSGFRGELWACEAEWETAEKLLMEV